MIASLEGFRFRRVTRAIAQVLGVEPPPECVSKNGRTVLTFRRLGATRWSEQEQVAFAFRAVDAARRALAAEDRRAMRAMAARAVVVALEDAAAVQGCAIAARWECTVPGQH